MSRARLYLAATAAVVALVAAGWVGARVIQSNHQATQSTCQLAKALVATRTVEQRVWEDFRARVQVSLNSPKLPPGQTRAQTLDTLYQIDSLAVAYRTAKEADARLAHC